MDARVSRILTQWRRAPEVLTGFRQTSDAAALALGYLGLRSPTYPFVVQFRGGERLRVETHHDLVTLWIIFFRNEYRVPKTCRTIIDAGANIGAFSLYAAMRAPTTVIHALEPFPSTRARLTETLEQNQLTSRVKVYDLGLADASASTRHMANVGPSQSRGTTTEAGPESVTVKVTTLEQFLDQGGIAEADFLKMDIEGAEHEVIHSSPRSVLRRFREIALEYHPNGSAEALFQRLTDCGFALQHDARAGTDSGVAHFARDAN